MKIEDMTREELEAQAAIWRDNCDNLAADNARLEAELRLVYGKIDALAKYQPLASQTQVEDLHDDD